MKFNYLCLRAIGEKITAYTFTEINYLITKRFLPIYKSTKFSVQRLKFDLFKPEKKPMYF